MLSASDAERRDVARVVLHLLYDGLSIDELLAQRPELSAADVARACGDGLAALEAAPRVETKAERVERLRRTHPRAYAPWDAEEDARLLFLHNEGAKVAAMARELGRQPNAVRARLEKWLGPDWRERRAAP